MSDDIAVKKISQPPAALGSAPARAVLAGSSPANFFSAEANIFERFAIKKVCSLYDALLMFHWSVFHEFAAMST